MLLHLGKAAHTVPNGMTEHPMDATLFCHGEATRHPGMSRVCEVAGWTRTPPRWKRGLTRLDLRQAIDLQVALSRLVDEAKPNSTH